MAAANSECRDVHEAQDPLSSRISHPACDAVTRLLALCGCRDGDMLDTPARGMTAPVSRPARCVHARRLHVCVSQLRAHSQVGFLARGAMSRRENSL